MSRSFSHFQEPAVAGTVRLPSTSLVSVVLAMMSAVSP